MFQQERQEKILEYINNHKKIRTKNLSKIFKTSVVTIRSDINELDKKGLIIKVHGGALAISDRLSLEIPSQNKGRQNIAVKRLIGKLAADLIEENDVVILDSGSTTLEVARVIKHKRVTIITNDLKIGMTLASESDDNITIILTGGTIQPQVYTMCGIETLEFLERIKVNKLILGCDAIDAEYGVSNRTLLEAGIKRAMISASAQVIAVADSSKHGKQVFTKVCDLSDIDIVVTDSISARNRHLFESLGLKVITPESKASGAKPRPVSEEKKATI